MDKIRIIRYIEGKADLKEKEQIESWIEQSENNKEYFNMLFNLNALQSHNPLLKPDFEELHIQEKKSLHLFKILQRVAAILLLPLLVTVAFLWTQNSKVSNAERDVIEMSTFAGVKGKVTLPDGSIVWMNSNSVLKYPRRFTGKAREVSLDGEAYFEVVKNPDFPMVVSTQSGVEVVVHGTKFNLSTYSNDETVTAALLEGSISIESSKKHLFTKPIHMKPNDVIVISKEKKVASLVRKNKQVEDYKAWKEGTLIFDNTPMQELVKMLERWHGVEIELTDSSLNEYRYTAKFQSESIVQIMELLKRTSPITYKIEDHKVIIAKK